MPNPLTPAYRFFFLIPTSIYTWYLKLLAELWGCFRPTWFHSCSFPFDHQANAMLKGHLPNDTLLYNLTHMPRDSLFLKPLKNATIALGSNLSVIMSLHCIGILIFKFQTPNRMPAYRRYSTNVYAKTVSFLLPPCIRTNYNILLREKSNVAFKMMLNKYENLNSYNI